jgi:hypothetical protein
MTAVASLPVSLLSPASPAMMMATSAAACPTGAAPIMMAATPPVLSPAVVMPTAVGTAALVGTAAAPEKQRAVKRARTTTKTADNMMEEMTATTPCPAASAPRKVSAKAAAAASSSSSPAACGALAGVAGGMPGGMAGMAGMAGAVAMPLEGEDGTLEEVSGVTGNKDWLIVAKSVRTMLKGMPNSIHCGANALPMLNVRVQELLTEAATRANGNSRKTIKACDF